MLLKKLVTHKTFVPSSQKKHVWEGVFRNQRAAQDKGQRTS
jgi:hypothetical protein